MSEENKNKIKKIQTSEKDDKNYSDFFADMVSHSPKVQKDTHGKFFFKDLDY